MIVDKRIPCDSFSWVNNSILKLIEYREDEENSLQILLSQRRKRVFVEMFQKATFTVSSSSAVCFAKRNDLRDDVIVTLLKLSINSFGIRVNSSNIIQSSYSVVSVLYSNFSHSKDFCLVILTY